MIGCSKMCIKKACCDFCIHAIHDEFIYPDGSDIIYGGPIGCQLHTDEEHQRIAENNWYCNDFYCINAQKPDKWIEVDINEYTRLRQSNPSY